MEEDIREILGEKTDAEFYVNFFCDAVICAFGRWISQKEPMPPKEFVNMIQYQRNFQANAKGITAADEMLAEVINMKR